MEARTQTADKVGTNIKYRDFNTALLPILLNDGFKVIFEGDNVELRHSNEETLVLTARSILEVAGHKGFALQVHYIA
jgi:hypothetical protein